MSPLKVNIHLFTFMIHSRWKVSDTGIAPGMPYPYGRATRNMGEAP